MNKTAALSRLTDKLPLALLAVFSLCSLNLEARHNMHLNDTVTVGMNAIDHILQRPLGSPVFDNKRFGDHLFISGGAGISVLGTALEDRDNRSIRPSYRFGVSLGDWVTPVHGWRIGAAFGSHSKREGTTTPYFGSISADYLMNFTALLRGHNPYRCFELIGGLGIEYQRIRNNGVFGNEYGARASIQARVNATRSMYVYLEPSLTMLAGTKLMNNDWRRFKPDVGINIGIGYRLLGKKERLAGATPFAGADDSHLFFGIGGGLSNFAHNLAYRSTTDNITGTAHIGKMFSSAAGLRLKAQYGKLGMTGDNRQRYLATGSLDYVWNISSAFGGYRPSELFSLDMNIGVAGAYVGTGTKKIYPGIEGGFTALFRLSPNWGIYIEPQMQFFTSGFSRDMRGRSYSPVASVFAGLRYTLGNFRHEFAEDYKEYSGARNWFITFAGAPARRLRGNTDSGIAAMVGFGKRFTPISSWRVSVDGEAFHTNPRYASLSVGADYLFSISTSMTGFNPHRIFDLSGLIGVNAGFAKTPDNMLAGGKAGLHGAFRLSEALDLFIEPQLLAAREFGHGNSRWEPEMRLMIGLNYRLGGSSSRHSESATPWIGDKRSFVSLAGGPMLSSNTFFDSKSERINGALDLAVGRWTSRVSGLRLGVTYDFVPDRNGSKPLNLFSAHADYMLNMTSLMDSNPARRFHIIGIAGIGAGKSDISQSRLRPMANAGMQFRYNLPGGIDLHIEPNVSFAPQRIAYSYVRNNRFIALGRIMAGLSYRF